MILRRATDADIEFFFMLRRDPEAQRASHTVLGDFAEHRAWWTRTTDHRWVAEAGTADVGTLRCSPAGLVSLIVAPEFRGHGYGLMMLELLLPEARQLGITHLSAEIAPDNLRSQRLFLRAGWRPILLERAP